MHQKSLLPLVHKEVKVQLKDYIDTTELSDIETYIVRPGLGGNQGIMGAVKLGMLESVKEMQ